MKLVGSGGSNSSAEMQSMYSTAPTDLAVTRTSQKFCNILVVRASWLHVYHVTETVQAAEKKPPVVSSIGVVSALKCYALIHFVCDLKVEQKNVQ